MHPPVADLLFFLRFFELNAMWVFQFLDWTESLLRHAWRTDGEGPARSHGRTGKPQTWVLHHFPRFNIRRLWRLSGRFLKQVLEDLARSLIHIIASSAGYG